MYNNRPPGIFASTWIGKLTVIRIKLNIILLLVSCPHVFNTEVTNNKDLKVHLTMKMHVQHVFVSIENEILLAILVFGYKLSNDCLATDHVGPHTVSCISTSWLHYLSRTTWMLVVIKLTVFIKEHFKYNNDTYYSSYLHSAINRATWKLCEI